MGTGVAPPLDEFFSRSFLAGVSGNLLPPTLPFVFALAVTTLATPLAMWAGRRLQVVAWPGGRHIHSHPTPKLGGLAMATGFTAAAAWSLPAGSALWGAVLLTGVAAAVFVWDDRFHMNPLLKLSLEGLLALIAIAAFGYSITYLTVPGLGEVQLGVIAYPLTVFWLLGMMNTTNLLDGVDGLAAGVVAIVAVVLGLAAVSRPSAGSGDVVILAAALAGCCLGFLLFNFHPARIFMGDSGSHFLGLALGLLSITGVAKVAVGAALLVPVLALAVPILDTGWAIVRRRRQGLSIAHADTRHIHHQLLDFGLSQRQTALVFYGATMVLGALGLTLFGHRRVVAVAIVAVVVCLSTALGEWLDAADFRLPAPGLRRLLGQGPAKP